jgi:ATP-dependent Lhr-like helicase
MDVQGAEQVVQWIQDGKIKIVEKNVSVPSPFAFNLYAQGYSDIMRMEGKLQFIRRMHALVQKKISEKAK